MAVDPARNASEVVTHTKEPITGSAVMRSSQQGRSERRVNGRGSLGCHPVPIGVGCGGGARLSGVSRKPDAMTCIRCGSDRLALVLEPGESEPASVVCLGCGALQEEGPGTVRPRSA